MEKEKQDRDDKQKRMETERERQIREESKLKAAQPPANVPPMEPVTHDAYGGGMYGTESAQKPQAKPAASETQSADGPAEFSDLKPNHTPPPSSGDRDIDITGQSYIQ